LIYTHLPQRSGKSIPVNSNYPPQDPPGPPKQNSKKKQGLFQQVYSKIRRIFWRKK